MKEITFAAMCCRLRIASYNLANKKQKFSIMNLQIMCNSTETVFEDIMNRKNIMADGL